MELLGEPLAQLRQQRVPGRLSVQVVHVLEAVEIGADHRELLTGPLGTLDAAGEARVHGLAVWQSGQTVVFRKIVDPAFRRPLLPQVAQGDDHMVGASASAGLLGQIDLHRDR